MRVAEKGGGTIFAHQGAAFDALPLEEQERWQRLVSVNSNSGVLHPVVHTHPISGRKSVYLHLGMTGAVIEVLDATSGHDKDGKDLADVSGAVSEPAQTTPMAPRRLRLLDDGEMRHLFQSYNALLNAGFTPSGADRLASAPRYGTPVTIHGLASATEAAAKLNGQRGVVSGVLDRTSGRVAVDLDASVLAAGGGGEGGGSSSEGEGGGDGAGGATVRLAIDPSNLEPSEVQTSEAAEAAEEAAYTAVYEYEAGDCIFIDNLAVAHRATLEAHQPASEVGLRILHRTTIRAEYAFDPDPTFGLPPRLNVADARTPKRVLGIDDGGEGVWGGGGLGFRWDETIPMQN